MGFEPAGEDVKQQRRDACFRESPQSSMPPPRFVPTRDVFVAEFERVRDSSGAHSGLKSWETSEYAPRLRTNAASRCATHTVVLNPDYALWGLASLSDLRGPNLKTPSHGQGLAVGNGASCSS